MLFQEDGKARVAMEIGGEVAEFTQVQGTWFSEEGAPVELRFEWQREIAPVPAENDCICSNEFASRLVGMLYAGGDEQGPSI